MRNLTAQEQEWVKSLVSTSANNNSPIANWLKSVFLKESNGRALIIQAKESYAVLFLLTSIFDDPEKKKTEVSNFLNLISLLKLLHSEGYIMINRGKSTRDTPMFFLQDNFLNPKPASGPIVLNAQGDYTERPDTIHSQDKHIIYQGITFEHDHFDLILATCTGSLIVSDTLNSLVTDKTGKNKSSKVTQHKSTVVLFIITTLVLIAALVAFYYLEWTPNKKSMQSFAALQSEMTHKIDSIQQGIANIKNINNSLAKEKTKENEAKNQALHYGIDISKWNGNVMEDINSKNQLSFVICKATEGSLYQDPMFDTNWEFMKTKGLIKGAYHFYRVNDDPITQAEHFVNTLGELKQNDISPILDIEPGSIPADFKIDLNDLEIDLFIFLRHVEKLSGRKPIIYTDVYFANEYLTNQKFAEYPLWIADYTNASTPIIPKTWEERGFKFWQKSESYDIDSDKTDFDMYIGKKEDIYN